MTGEDQPKLEDMADLTLIDLWSKMIGLEDELNAPGPDRIERARSRLSRLMTVGTEDELRHLLAFGDEQSSEPTQVKVDPEVQSNNNDLALFILSESISCARQGGPPADCLTLVDWLLLVAQYGTEANLYHAHAKLLQGLFYLSNQQDLEAKTSFEEGLQSYAYAADNDSKGPSSICLYCLGVILADRDQFDQSIDFFQRASESAPAGLGWQEQIEREMQAARAQQLLADELVKAASEEQVRKIVELDRGVAGDRTIRILRNRAFLAAYDGKVQTAVTVAGVADWLAKSLKKEIGVRRSLAEAALYQNQYATAEAVLRPLLSEFPDDLELQKKFARSCWMQGKNEEAKEILEKVIARAPHDAEALRELGIVHTHRQQPDIARNYLEAALTEDPSDGLAKRALEHLGISDARPGVAFDKETGTLSISEELFNQPQADMGLMILAAMLRANPETAQEVLQDVASKQGVEYAQRALELAFPEAAKQPEPTHFDKAEELFRTRQLPEALKEYKLAIAEDPDHADAYMGVGDCYYHFGQLNLATAFFEESVAVQPRPSTLTFLGDAHRKSGRTEEAIKAYEQAVELDPGYTLARQQLEAIKGQSGRK